MLCSSKTSRSNSHKNLLTATWTRLNLKLHWEVRWTKSYWKIQIRNVTSCKTARTNNFVQLRPKISSLMQFLYFKIWNYRVHLKKFGKVPEKLLRKSWNIPRICIFWWQKHGRKYRARPQKPQPLCPVSNELRNKSKREKSWTKALLDANIVKRNSAPLRPSVDIPARFI